MIGILAFFVSLGFTGLFYFYDRLKGRSPKLLSLSLIGVPLTLFVITDYGRTSLGLLLSLVVLALPGLFGSKKKITKYSCLLAAFLVAFYAGFKIQFANLAFTEGYLYFTWLALPITVGWLFSISRSVEIINDQLEGSWKVFLTILFVVTVAFLVLVLLQGEELRFGFLLGTAMLGAYTGLFFFPVKSYLRGHLARQLGFLLAALAISGVVKSLTTFVLIAPVASLALPITSKSFAFVRGGERRIKEERTAAGYLGDFLGSKDLAMFVIYAFLSYLGIGLAWSVRSPGPGSVSFIVSSIVFFPSLSFALRYAVKQLGKSRALLFDRGGEVQIFGTRFDTGRFEEAVKELVSLRERAGTSYVATPDVTAVMRAREKNKLKKAYRSADLVVPDGFGLIWASDLVGLNLDERIAGIDLLKGSFESAEDLSVYLLGARPGVAESAGERIDAEFSGVQVVGTEHGYFDFSRSNQVIEGINRKSPDVLLVGMGVPLQEEWILDNKEEISAELVMGVGGSFDVFSGRLPRAPRWMRERGLEWLFRIVLEPGRLWRARLIPAFMVKVYYEKIKTRLKNEVL